MPTYFGKLGNYSSSLSVSINIFHSFHARSVPNRLVIRNPVPDNTIKFHYLFLCSGFQQSSPPESIELLLEQFPTAFKQTRGLAFRPYGADESGGQVIVWQVNYDFLSDDEKVTMLEQIQFKKLEIQGAISSVLFIFEYVDDKNFHCLL